MWCEGYVWSVGGVGMVCVCGVCVGYRVGSVGGVWYVWSLVCEESWGVWVCMVCG